MSAPNGAIVQERSIASSAGPSSGALLRDLVQAMQSQAAADIGAAPVAVRFPARATESGRSGEAAVRSVLASAPTLRSTRKGQRQSENALKRRPRSSRHGEACDEYAPCTRHAKLDPVAA